MTKKTTKQLGEDMQRKNEVAAKIFVWLLFFTTGAWVIMLLITEWAYGYHSEEFKFRFAFFIPTIITALSIYFSKKDNKNKALKVTNEEANTILVSSSVVLLAISGFFLWKEPASNLLLTLAFAVVFLDLYNLFFKKQEESTSLISYLLFGSGIIVLGVVIKFFS
ncbi:MULTISPECIES: hypothetical protein [Vibrio harveyi group]|nr:MULTISPECIES: hypothetical protein [Vibrio harveyi group]MBE3844934.1 hypothetical protein [Vibrio parahaemolyticus]MBE4129728.1 hypothetical protein [Vibrio parahaemolyticus]MBE4781770.1 hypothetical protein [Vibrio parahaemolyticus]MCG6220997.1 hypothetical protein [Vibrio diabolicus]MCG6242021.1 hypothetical protein [Vibrio diabolicus]